MVDLKTKGIYSMSHRGLNEVTQHFIFLNQMFALRAKQNYTPLQNSKKSRDISKDFFYHQH